MTHLSSRLSIILPDLSDQADVPLYFQDMANVVDNAVIYSEGTFGARPAAAIKGRVYFDTGGRTHYYDTGTMWLPLQNPAGTIIYLFTGTLPNGYFWCDGSAVSRTTYAALFAAIGTTFGAGDGSTTFNVPFLAGGTFLVQRGANALGSVGGEATHTLSNGEMPSHNHGGITLSMSANATHTHTTSGTSPVNNVVSATPGVGSLGIPAGTGGNATVMGAANIDHAHSIVNDGSGLPHNNIPPYCAVNYAIKT